jgi:dephospho-CoA kinase
MRLIVLTGGIACGKTTAANYLRDQWGCTVIDSDSITRDVQAPGTPTFRQIIAAFGEKMVNFDGTLNRRRLADVIFHDADGRRKLNAIVHPVVFRGIIRSIFDRWIRRDRFVIIDVPLFFEVRLSPRYFHEIITVALDPAKQIRRLMIRNDLTLEDAKVRVESQMPIEEKCSRSTIVVWNDGNEQDLHIALDKVVLQLQSGSAFTYVPDPLFVLVFLVFMIGIAVRLIL